MLVECSWASGCVVSNEINSLPLDDAVVMLNIFKFILQIDIMIISREVVHMWMPQNTFNDKSTLVQVMVWCREVTNHYLGQIVCKMSAILFRSRYVDIVLCLEQLRQGKVKGHMLNSQTTT